MSIQKVNASIENYLQVAWAGRTEIAWENVSYVPTRGVPYIKTSLFGNGSTNISRTCVRQFYVLTIQVFTPAEEGTEENYTYAQELERLFLSMIEAHLDVTSAYSERAGDDNEWFQSNVTIEFQYDNHYN